ncbi:unnamed protein product [Somion occarium]
MVADENAHGASDLPVIDFADLNVHPISHPVALEPRPRKQKASKKAPRAPSAEPVQAPPVLEAPPQTGDHQPAPAEEGPIASTSRHSSRERQGSFRSRGQTSRQAYQQRLESDPSFVPKVGEFWGHDDRLLDKDLRSLSGWWRGRWQSRGRGRGFPIRGRGGRGGFLPGRPPHQGQGDELINSAPVDVPPIERPWTHDGFEEMKNKEDRRRSEIRQRVEAERQERSESRQKQGSPHPSNSSQRGLPFRGRGGFVTQRGRGGFTRGVSSPAGRPFILPPGRVWYAMKPEKPFTQQHDSFLYFDPSLKPRPGQGAGLRIKLPGREPLVIRTPPRSSHSAKPSLAGTDTASVTTGSEWSDRVFTVRIPTRPDVEKAQATTSTHVSDVVVAEELKGIREELSIDEVFTVRPHAGPQHVPLEIPQSVKAEQPAVTMPAHRHTQSIALSSPARPISFLPEPEIQQQLETIIVQPPVESSVVSVNIEETVLRRPQSAGEIYAPVPQASQEESRPGPPVLPPIQTSFSPVPQASPPFHGSPYGYPPALPPGVAMSQLGYPYEVATGRPVYIQPTPPPVMYNPRPMMQGHMQQLSNGGVPFVPGHMHHPSSVSSPDFLAQPHTPPVNGFIDPSTGVPIFAPPRQSSRVEIRAPSDRSEGKGTSSRNPPGPSSLRTSVIEPETFQNENEVEPSYIAQPFEPVGGDSGAEPREEAATDAEQSQTLSPPMMPYNPYAQPYYYPEGYGYNPYLDMSQPVMHYEMYPADPNNQRGQSQPILYY